MNVTTKRWFPSLFLLLGSTGLAFAQAPVAVDDAYEAPAGQTLVVEEPGVLENDQSANGEDLPGNATAELGSLTVSHGALALSPDGSFTFTPENGFTGTDQFTYRVRSGAFASGEATVTITVTSCSGVDPIVCWVESSFQEKLAALGYRSFREGFENDDTWSAVPARSIDSGALTWTSNFDLGPGGNSQITTSTGSARTGSRGVYALPHGDPDGVDCDHNPGRLEKCTYDGFIGTAPGGLFAVGGWLVSNTGGARVQFVLDGSTATAIGFPDPMLTTQHRFFGVIRTQSFSTFEIRETEGSPLDQEFFFADDFTFGVVDDVAPVVTRINSVQNTGDGELSEGEEAKLPITQLLVTFSEAVQDPPVQNPTSETPVDDVTNPANYLLLGRGGNGVFDTASCAAGLAADDIGIPVNSVGYAASSFTATMSVNGGTALSSGSYRLLVCGTTTIKDLVGNALDGDGNGTGGDDFARNFSVSVNNAPVAVNDGYGVAEGNTLNVAALGVLSNDTDDGVGSSLVAVLVPGGGPAHGTLTLNADGSFSYSHDGGETTSDSFTYKATDGFLDSNVATVSISVTPVNDAPTAANNFYSVDEGDTLAVAAALGVLFNDSDPDTASLTAIKVSDPAHGTITLNADGSFTYIHHGTETDSDSFTYKASDGFLDSNIATVSIGVRSVNDAPVAADEAYGVDEGETLNVPAPGVLLNATDAEDDALVAISVMDPVHGTLVLNADGSFSYTHDGSESTSDSFTYKANDGLLESNIATVTISVTLTNDAPVAVGDAYTVDEGGTLDVAAALGVLLNDTDAESDPLTALKVSDPAHGTVTLNADGSFTYIHDGSETSSDSFSYKANDGAVDSNLATVSISVNPTNEPPIAVVDYYQVAQGGTIHVGPETDILGVLANDTDAESDPLTAVKVTDPAHGTLCLNSDGSFTYTHDGGDSTSDSFTYKANDGLADSNVATVSISVETPPEPGLAIDDVSVWEGRRNLFDDSARAGGFFAKRENAVFTVSLSSPSPHDVTVVYNSAPDTASAERDYKTVSAELMIPAGKTSATIEVQIRNDRVLEQDESFFVELSDASGATISDGVGKATILDDEACVGPNLLFNPGADEETSDLGLPGWAVVEGSGWQQRFSDPKRFRKSAYFSAGQGTVAELSQDIDISAYAERIQDGAQMFAFEGRVRTFDETMGGAARIIVEYRNRENDFVLDHYDSGLVSTASNWERVTDERAAPKDSGWIRVRLIAERGGLDDQAGIFFDSLSLESLGVAVLTVDDHQVKETDSRARRRFTAWLSCRVDSDVTFDYATGDGTATAAEDYDAVLPTTVTLPRGKRRVSLPVEVLGDLIVEEDEFFLLRLTNATNAVILTPEAACVILDNDCLRGSREHWEEQFGNWPVDELMLGGVVYDAPSLLDLLSSRRGNPSRRLARELVSTKLNLAAGSAPDILPVVDEADAFLMEHPLPWGRPRPESSGSQARALEMQLKQYNKDLCVTRRTRQEK